MFTRVVYMIVYTSLHKGLQVMYMYVFLYTLICIMYMYIIHNVPPPPYRVCHI